MKFRIKSFLTYILSSQNQNHQFNLSTENQLEERFNIRLKIIFMMY
jgi:hypothetical protein